MGPPLQYKNVEKYTIDDFSNLDLNWFQPTPQKNTKIIIEYIDSNIKKGDKAYILFTRSEKATFNSTSGLPPGSLDRMEQMIGASADFKLIYYNRDAQIYQFVTRGGATR